MRSVQIKEAGYSRHFKFLKEIEIPIPFKDGTPDFDDQIRIAHLLGKVEGLIAQRKQHLQHLDDLLKSVFLEMFGDPVRNEKGWSTPTLIEVAYFENGDRSSNYPSGPDLVDDGILFLSTKNIVKDRLNLDSKVFITQEKFESLSRGKATVGDVLITLRGTLGSCCIYDSDKYLQAFINAQMMIMRPKALIRSIYLHAFITSSTIARLLQQIGNGAAVPQLTATQLKGLRIPLPPPELQEEYAAVAEKIETLKSRYQKSLTELESLNGALSQQAFKGELDLSRVPLPKDESHENDQSLNMQKNRLGVR
ncbi:MAG: restriction endonuclease subunit S [Pseudomonadales bacterium]